MQLPGEPTVQRQYAYEPPIRHASFPFRIGLGIVILAIVIVSAVYVVWSAPPPVMDLKVTSYAPGCVNGSLTQTIRYALKITNLGTISGVEQVTFLVDGPPLDSLPKQELGSEYYTLAPHVSLMDNTSFVIGDCLRHVPWYGDVTSKA